MTARLALGVALAALACAVPCPRQAAAQLYPAQATRYLLTTEARDARALWVNPAGLARGVEASVGVDATMDGADASVRLQQYGATLMSRNFAVGWIHDAYPGGASSDNYALGAGLGDEVLSMGVSRRWFGGRDGDRAWDLALRARATATLDLSVVWRNVGSPVVRDSIYPASVVPAAGVHSRSGRLGAGVELDLRTDLGAIRELRAGASVAAGTHLLVGLRGEFSSSLDRRGFAVSVTWLTSRVRSTVVAVLPPDAGSIDALGAAGAMIATPETRTRR